MPNREKRAQYTGEGKRIVEQWAPTNTAEPFTEDRVRLVASETRETFYAAAKRFTDDIKAKSDPNG